MCEMDGITSIMLVAMVIKRRVIIWNGVCTNPIIVCLLFRDFQKFRGRGAQRCD